jgi:nondiscriminating aspartyl-tRNA synthetase
MSTPQITSIQAPAFLNKTVQLKGHIQTLRKMGNLIFLVLRDRSGSLQFVVEDPSVVAQVEHLQCETPIEITGEVVEHPGKTPKSSQTTASAVDPLPISAKIEIRTVSVKPLASPPGPLPVEISKDKRMDSLSVPSMLDYRPLTLRNPKVRAIFKIAACLSKSFRDFLTAEEFVEIHSPKIVATGTEGGSNLFRLDYFGKQAFLAQSPQFYKQIMVGVFERVFELAAVYRAEEHDTSRHMNEYVSMDFEMGFIESEQDLISMQTNLLRYMFETTAEKCALELSLYETELPKISVIPQITLADACDLLQKSYKWKTDGPDLDPEGERLLCEHFSKTENSEFVYVTQYPTAVRPFYAMPLNGKLTHSFDLLYRGLEVTTGGQRIHEYEQLKQSIVSRGMDPESFSDYLQCFQYGMPPHGGLAIGLERLVKQILGLPNVKLASLFPRDRNRLSP